MKYKKRYITLKYLRLILHAAFFLLFVYIFIRSRDPFNLIFNPFLKYDPLIFLTHFDTNLLLPVVLPVILTLIAGRFFCGWACPLGFLIDSLDFILKSIRKKFASKLILKSESLKNLIGKLTVFPPSFFLLGIVLVTIFNSVPLLQFLHPNIWIVRIFSFTTGGFIFLAVLFIMSMTGTRVWCRYLCPLGAFYAVLSKFSVFKLRLQKCSSCGLCEYDFPGTSSPSCPMKAVDYKNQRVYNHQCILCFNYEYRCPSEGFAYLPSIKSRELHYDPSRRDFIKQLMLFASGALIGSLTMTKRKTYKTKLLRPPGVTDEDLFVKRCLRCLQCVESCPNKIIRITGIEGGIPGLLTPHLVFDEYGCDYNCQVCQIVCPNSAIPLQTLAEKQQTKIGIARINRELCVVYKKKINCIVCEEFCPTTPKAIVITTKELILPDGTRTSLHYPEVDKNLCIGCGICEANCPVNKKAIRVYKV